MERGVLGRTTGVIPYNPHSERVQGQPYYNSDITNENNISQDWRNGGGCCLGGWVSTLLGGGGGGGGDVGQDPLTTSMAHQVATVTTTSTNNNDDPTILVAQELNKLSLKEDESNLDLVNQRFNDMEIELEKISRSKKVAYLIAMEEFGEIGKEYCEDTNLHILFLRADRWDSKKAATRFVGWLDWKLRLFGRKVLCHRHITLDKLEKETREAPQIGLSQILPQRDTSGRTFIFDNIGRHTKKASLSGKNMLELFWYILMATIEDNIQTQRMGIVYILYSVDGILSFTPDDLKYMYDGSCMLPMLPVRINCLHYCFNDPKMAPIISMMPRTMGSHLRARFRSHKGNHTEVQYSLMTYGVPTDVLPVTANGDIKTPNHLKWCKL